MTAPRYTRITTALLSSVRRDSMPEPPETDARAAAIAAIEKAIVAWARARRRNRGLAFAAAAVVVMGLGAAASASRGAPLAVAQHASFPVPAPIVHAEGEGVELVDGGEPRAETEAAPVTQGQRLVARSQGRALLAFATGTELLLEERGDLTVQDGGASQRFALGGGSMSARVAKLEDGQRFVVATPDAEVEVRGTAFRVSVVDPESTCNARSKTRVEVTEGTVVVRHGGVESKVSAGQTWPADCAPKPAPVAVATTPAVAPSVAPASALAQQNDMFAEAIAAKRRGASAQAVAAFDRFLAKYPNGALAESAMAERMKLLHTPAAAKQYLARYPNGFARADAQAILGD